MMLTNKGIIYKYIYPRIKDNIKSPELNKLYDFFNTVDIFI